jgi:subtilisin
MRPSPRPVPRPLAASPRARRDRTGPVRRRGVARAKCAIIAAGLTGASLLGGASFADAATTSADPALPPRMPAPAPLVLPPPPAAPYVVVFQDDTAAPVAVTTGLAHRLAFDPRLRYETALKGFSAALTRAQVDALRAEPDVAFVEPDAEVVATGTQPLAGGESTPPGIRRVGGASATLAHEAAASPIAVVDSGIDLANADLNASSGINCVKPGTAANDDNGHGTNVAGIIAARNNGTGLVGVAPGTRLYAVKALGRTGTGTLSQILCAINWVTANRSALGIRVANMSIGGSGADDGNCGNTNNDAWHKAICASVSGGITWIVSAGNSGVDFARSIPAAYPEVLTATAMSDTDGTPGASGPAPSCKKGEADDRYASFSNYAVRAADLAHTIAAPGTCIASTKNGGGTSTYYGTSQAAPHVTAAVSLCLGTASGPGPCAGLSPTAIAQRVLADATANDTLGTGFAGDPLRPVTGRNYGPLINAAAY